ncbi:hypothetical protein [Ornithinimicrobium kibberense]
MRCLRCVAENRRVAVGSSSPMEDCERWDSMFCGSSMMMIGRVALR